MISKKDIFTIPNLLSFLRLGLVPVYTFLYLHGKILPASIILAISCLTDLLDGFIARRFHMVSDFGKFLDPLADKFLVIGTLVAIAFKDRGGALVYTAVLFISIIVVVMRELAVTSLRLLVSKKYGEVIAAKWLGKIKTVSQMVCIIVVLLEPVLFGESRILSYITISFMTLMTILSGIDYFRSYWSFIDFTK